MGLPTALSIMLYVLSGCGGPDTTAVAGIAAAPRPPAQVVALSVTAQLGEKIFHDLSLSASGNLACSSCHDPANAHAQINDFAGQLGGVDQHTPGSRATPSLRYLNMAPAFSFNKNGVPIGSFDRDGRAASLSEQARRPFLAAHEMANASIDDVTSRISRARYAEEFRKVFGPAVFDSPAETFDRIRFALQQYQKEDPSFFPFDAKYDQFLAGKVMLNNAELRGLALFNNSAKGNCAACHVSAKGVDEVAPLFTDFSYDNIGVPRNPAIKANADPAFFDLGLCGPDRTDLSSHDDLCGKFKVPTLHNVVTRKVFFHNGRFSTLHDALGFYVRRDTNPEEWYPRNADGSVKKFDDLPPEYKKNVNRTEMPYNRLPGMTPALSTQEIDDVIAFLGTLTDGYQIKN